MFPCFLATIFYLPEIFFKKVTRNYFNNHRYDGLKKEEVEAIKNREAEVTKMGLFYVMSYHYPNEIQATMKMDKSSDIVATKMKRAIPLIFNSLSFNDQKKMKHEVNVWKEDGPPPSVQQK